MRITSFRHCTLLALAVITFTLPAAADEPSAPSAPKIVAPVPAPAPAVGGPVAPTNTNGLTRINGGLTADGARAAGQSRNVEMAADTNAPAAGKPVRPVPTPRVLRKLGSERVVASIEPGVVACASESKSNAPTAFGVRVSIGPDGEVESAELASAVRPPPGLVACVVSAVRAAKFGAPGPSGASIVVPITVPGRPSSAAGAPAPKTTTSTTMSVIAAATPSTPTPASAPIAIDPSAANPAKR